MAISVWTAKANVLAALAPLVPASADIVQLGAPTENPTPTQQRRIYILDVPTDSISPIFTPGTQFRTENFVIPIAVEFECIVPPNQSSADGYANAQAGLGTLVGLIETQQLADPSWGRVATESGIDLVAEHTAPLADMQAVFMAVALLNLHIRTRGN